MKKFVKKLISLLCSVCLSFAVFVPFILVSAESQTYAVIQECTWVATTAFQNLGRFSVSANKPVNVIFVINRGDNAFVVMMYDEPFTRSSNFSRSYTESIQSCGTLSSAGVNSFEVNGKTYYCWNEMFTNFGKFSEIDGNWNERANVQIPYVIENGYWRDIAFDYIYGNNAVGPEPPGPVYGNLADVSYSSNIAGSGSDSSNNVDVIRWNNVVDNHNNLVPSDAVVDIRAIPGEYQASDKQSLLTKIYTDLILDYTSFATLANVPFSNGQKSFTWSDVVSRFGNPWVFGNFISMVQGDSYWYKQGWIYEVRLRIPSEEFIGDWIGIRNLTSSGVENSNNAIDNNGLNSTLIQTINNVNNINSTENNNYVTNNNYYYNEYPIPSNSSDLSDLTSPLQAILDAILSIPRKIGEKIQEVLNNIYEWLFVYEFDIEDYEEQKNRMLEESGAFGEILTHLETMKENIDNHNGASYVPLITWSDVYVMDEVMIPAGTFNLGSLVAEDPMRAFYLLYQTIVSGYLYFTLFRFLYKKIIKTLRT